MFSGIIRKIGEVEKLDLKSDSAVLTVRASGFFSACLIGDSVSVNGVCLTVVARGDDFSSFDIASETLRKTSLGALKIGSEVNLEHSLRLGDSVDGHFVSGHVDGTMVFLGRELEGNSWKCKFEYDLKFKRYLSPKGSLAIDGVSLTIGEVWDKNLSVYIIPHTFENTIFKNYSSEGIVNLEIDPLARYVVHALESHLNNN